MTKLADLAAVFGLLSILAVGGGVAVLPQMERETVGLHHWLTRDQFVDVYSLGQMAPGPNMLMVSVIGWRVAGAAGAAVVLAAFFLPASLLTLAVSRLWDRFAASPWRVALQRGLAPVSIGLMASGIVTIGKGALLGPVTIGLAAAVTAILLVRRVNPAYLILASGVIGWLASAR